MPPGRLVDLLHRRAVAWACLALLCTGLGAAALRPIWDGDLGWHLAMGRDVALHARVPDTEPFTHTARGNPMVANEWLTQLVYHAVTDVAGIRGLRVLHALVTALAPALFFWMLRSAGISAALCVAGVLVWAVIAESRFALRPQMLSLLLSMASFQLLFVRRPTLTDRQLVAN